MELALYVRVSTSRQQQTQTIEQQIDHLQAHVATQPDWHLAEEHIYRDDGYSGAKLNRPGLDRLRERAAMAAFERVLITAPDRLARNYVHQMLLIDELTQRGCQVEFLDRPMSDDPHDQLLLQIRGAVAEYERNLIADRMRRGRQAKLRSGQLLPWTRAPYGYLLDPERPRDPTRLRLDPVNVAVVEQIFAWYTDLQEPATLYRVAKRLSEQQIPTPTGGCRWNVATIRGMLRDPAYAGTAYSGRTQPAPARRRKSALHPVGAGESTQPAPQEEWIAIAVPAIVSQETFALAQERLDRNKQTARRNNTAHDYLLRGLVSCGLCHLSCMGRSLQPGYAYYVCRGRSDALRVAKEERCTARYAPALLLDDLVWQDLCRVITEPALITHELERAQLGEWLPQALQARRRTLQEALAHLDRQQARLLEVYLAEIIGRDEFERKRQEVDQTQSGLRQQLRHLEAQAHKQVDVMAAAAGIEAFCRRIQPTLEQLTFTQRRQLVELLIDRVIVSDEKVEIRYVLPTGPVGESTPFCHLRKDYFHRPAAALRPPRQRRRTARLIRDQVQVRPLRLVHADACQTNMAQVRTVDAGASDIVANAVRQPVMQLPAQGVHPLPLPRHHHLVIARQGAVPAQPLTNQVVGQHAGGIPAIEDHVLAVQAVGQGFGHQVTGQHQFGLIAPLGCLLLRAPQAEAQGDPHGAAAGEQDYDIDGVDVASLGRTPQAFGPGQGLAGRFGHDDIIDNPHGRAECPRCRSQTGHQQGWQAALAQQTGQAVVTDAGQRAGRPGTGRPTLDQQHGGNVVGQGQVAPGGDHLGDGQGRQGGVDGGARLAHPGTTPAVRTDASYGRLLQGGLPCPIRSQHPYRTRWRLPAL